MTRARHSVPWFVLVVLLVIFFYVWPGVWRFRYYSEGRRRLDVLTGRLYERYRGDQWYTHGFSGYRAQEICQESFSKGRTAAEVARSHPDWDPGAVRQEYWMWVANRRGWIPVTH